MDRVVIAQLSGGGYAAASQVCSHFSTELVIYEPTVDEWHCLSHGARFQRSSGVPTNTVTKRNLRLYPTTLNGSMLSVRG